MIVTKFIRCVPYRMCRFFHRGVRILGRMSGISLSNLPVVMSERALEACRVIKALAGSIWLKHTIFYDSLVFLFNSGVLNKCK